MECKNESAHRSVKRDCENWFSLVSFGNLENNKHNEKLEKGRCPCVTQKRMSYIHFEKGKETQRRKEIFLNDKRLPINQEIADKRIFSCTNTAKLESVGKYTN
jgi:hypothetical protein